MTDFADRLKELRVERKITQQKLAKETNISQTAISAYETSKAKATEEVIVVLSKYFNVSADFLLGLSDDF